jgi:hypothetical protein
MKRIVLAAGALFALDLTVVAPPLIITNLTGNELIEVAPGGGSNATNYSPFVWNRLRPPAYGGIGHFYCSSNASKVVVTEDHTKPVRRIRSVRWPNRNARPGGAATTTAVTATPAGVATGTAHHLRSW